MYSIWSKLIEAAAYLPGRARTGSDSTELKIITFADLPFLLLSGLDRERVGVQYRDGEWLKQFRIAPLRYFNKSTRSRSFLVVVNGRRAGYVGLNPLSTNVEYYLQPWARGGRGRTAVTEFLGHLLPSNRDEHAFMLAGNDRSVMTFRRSLEMLGLTEGVEFDYFVYEGGSGFRIRGPVTTAT